MDSEIPLLFSKLHVGYHLHLVRGTVTSQWAYDILVCPTSTSPPFHLSFLQPASPENGVPHNFRLHISVYDLFQFFWLRRNPWARYSRLSRIKCFWVTNLDGWSHRSGDDRGPGLVGHLWILLGALCRTKTKPNG